MGTELPTKVMLGQKLVLLQMTFLNNVRKVGRSVLSRTSCYGFCTVLTVNRDYFLNSINKLIFVMVKSCVFFAVRTEFLNIILSIFGFKGLMLSKAALPLMFLSGNRSH
jgi:hypothetical protein